MKKFIGGRSMKKFIGVDLHKGQFNVCIKYEDGKEEMKRYKMDEKGIRDFKEILDKETEVGVECSGGSRYFYDKIADLVKAVRVINPLQFRVISKSVKKTDKEDARAIANFLSKGIELPEVRVQKKETRELKSLIETRDKLVKLRTQLKNKLHGIMLENGIKTKREEFSTKKGLERLKGYELSEVAKFEVGVIIREIESLNERIKEIEERIKEEGDKLKGQKELQSIKGIGKLSSTIILANIEDVKDFEEEKKIMAYAGLVPKVRESNGKKEYGRITKRGNKILRTTLVQVGLVAIRYSERLKRFYKKIKERKGSGKAIIAVARKILGIIYHLLKESEIYKESEIRTRGKRVVEYVLSRS